MYFLPFTSYRFALLIKKASSRYSIYVTMVFLEIFDFKTLLKVASIFDGVVREPVAEARILRIASSSSVFLIPFRSNMSLRYVLL